jgi:hypothetical protein
MSTRAVYTVYEDQTPIHIYIHHDGYPAGAADHIRDAMEFAWKMPRFEADEFAAALCAGVKCRELKKLIAALENPAEHTDSWRNAAAVKKRIAEGHSTGGGVRIFKTCPIEELHLQSGDLAYRYEIRYLDKQLWIKAFSTDYWDGFEESEIFNGSFDSFAARAKEIEGTKNQNA